MGVVREPQRQPERELRTGARRTCDRKIPTKEIRKLTRDRQAQPRSLQLDSILHSYLFELDKDALERVFVEFEQIAVEDGVKLQGTGLGLSISRKLAYLLGGNLTVTSTPGSGSEFTLRLPLRFADDPHE